MKVKEKRWIRFRIWLVAVSLFLGLFTMLARAVQLQVLERDRLGAMAAAHYRETVKLPPDRGAIYDRQGHELAATVQVGSIYAHPNRIQKKAKTAGMLAAALKEDRRYILKKLRTGRSFVWIRRKVSPEKVQRVKELRLDYVGVAAEAGRYYPGRELAAHILGFVGVDNQGLEGLEKKYDDLLRGPQYRLVQMTDAMRRPFYVSRVVPSGERKHDLVLTIDKDIQYRAQKALREAVKRSGARGGHCVVVNPATGEILALAVAPEFNPNAFSRYSPDQWRNRVVTDSYEPGSTMKAFLLAAALEEDVVTGLTRFDCEHGDYSIAGHVIHDTHKYGVLTVSDIIVRSSNIGAAKIGGRLGYSRFLTYLKAFGFGQRTGSDFLGEARGFLRPAAAARPIDRLTAFFGQGLSVTSLQLVMGVAALANGGKLMRPYVVKEVRDDSGKVVRRNHPQMVRRVISPQTALSVSRILQGVVGEEGTGRSAAISGYRVAGKTGTAQKLDRKIGRYSKSKYVASFVGFAPAEDPKVAILVMIDEPKGIPYGGEVAGPVFRQIGYSALNHLRVPPSARYARCGGAPRSGAECTAASKDVRKIRVDPPLVPVVTTRGRLPDFRGLSMREVLRKASTLGVEVKLNGSGFAYRQSPRAGTPIARLRQVRVGFRPPAT